MDRKISVIGLGYVGLPVVVAFGKHSRTVGFDINKDRVDALKRGIDLTGEVSGEELKSANLELSAKPEILKLADFHILAVPTPVDKAHRPDLTPVISACEVLAPFLKPADIVVLESTVYPGVTEEVCVPILERLSGLVCGKDFFVGYSPERINPGDKERRFTTIKKVVAGMNPETTEIIARTYSSVIIPGVFKAGSIRVAEAAKVIENTQRDLNIALMNELAIIFDKMGISTREVLEAASTKWNFLNFSPGLVGGHCIGVDPYYLTYKAEELGYIPQVILAGRKINDQMGNFIAQKTVKLLMKNNIATKDTRVAVLGFTFKENCPDTRNTRVIDLVNELKEYGLSVDVHDPIADPEEVKSEYGFTLKNLDEIKGAAAVIFAVAHTAYKDLIEKKGLYSVIAPNGVVVDVKGIISQSVARDIGTRFWSL